VTVKPSSARFGLRTVLMLAAAGLLAIVLGGLLIPLASSTAHHTFDEVRTDETTAGSVLAAQVSDAVARAAQGTAEPRQPAQSLTSAVSAVVRATGMRVLVVDLHRRVLADSTNRTPLSVVLARPDAGLQQVLGDRTPLPSPVARNVANELVVTVPVLEAGRIVGAVQVARPMSAVRSRTNSRDLALVGLGLLALAVGIGLAAGLSIRLTRPVRRLSEVARRFGAGELEARASPDAIRELAQLGESFNTMADALVANVNAQQEFAANASHQLKTPLTGLRMRLEAIATDTDGAVDARSEARKALADVERLNTLTEDLLELAHATAPVYGGERVDLGALADHVVQRWEETANRRGKRLTIRTTGTASVHADPEDLEHLIDNLIDNAVRYSPDHAGIDVEVSGSTLTVTDDGPGIPTGEQTHIFERFYRGQRGRTAAPGTGLGLAVVAALAARWGGQTRLVPGVRTRFEVRFPAGDGASRLETNQTHS